MGFTYLYNCGLFLFKSSSEGTVMFLMVFYYPNVGNPAHFCLNQHKNSIHFIKVIVLTTNSQEKLDNEQKRNHHGLGGHTSKIIWSYLYSISITQIQWRHQS